MHATSFSYGGQGELIKVYETTHQPHIVEGMLVAYKRSPGVMWVLTQDDNWGYEISPIKVHGRYCILMKKRISCIQCKHTPLIIIGIRSDATPQEMASIILDPDSLRDDNPRSIRQHVYWAWLNSQGFMNNE